MLVSTRKPSLSLVYGGFSCTKQEKTLNRVTSLSLYGYSFSVLFCSIFFFSPPYFHFTVFDFFTNFLFFSYLSYLRFDHDSHPSVRYHVFVRYHIFFPPNFFFLLVISSHPQHQFYCCPSSPSPSVTLLCILLKLEIVFCEFFFF